MLQYMRYMTVRNHPVNKKNYGFYNPERNFMSNQTNLIRYSKISTKNPREIVLLRGSGCVWKRCRFCDYHLDFSNDSKSNFELNKKVLDNVTGEYRKLEVINSGSFVDLDQETIHFLASLCINKNIKELHFESHWMHRDAISAFRTYFLKKGIRLKFKIGVETFDDLFRECYLIKGITAKSPSEIATYFDEVCLLFGIPGQTYESMYSDVETGLKHFERVCINIMTKNSTPIKPDPKVIDIFKEKIYPLYCNNERVDILLNNTDFGVGGVEND